MPVADAHVHIDLYLDRLRVITEAVNAGVEIVAVTTRPSEYRNLTVSLGAQSGNVRLGLGLHPEAAGCVYESHELAILESLFDSANWIGEIGIDAVIADRVGSYFGNVPSLAKQRKTFERILSLGIRDKVLSVHSQAAESLVVAMLTDADARAVALHWYRGDRATAERALARGYQFSVNSGMAATPQGRDLLQWLPSDSLLLETDGPFTDAAGSAAEPMDVLSFARELALLRSTDVDSILRAVSANFERLEQDAISA